MASTMLIARDSPSDVFPFDLNADGLFDLVVPHLRPGGIGVFLQTPGLTDGLQFLPLQFSDAPALLDGLSFESEALVEQSAVVVDLERDGLAEIRVASGKTAFVGLAPEMPSERFSPRVPLGERPLGPLFSTPLLLDVQLDGYPDLLTQNAVLSTRSAFDGQGSAVLSETCLELDPLQTVQPVPVDFNDVTGAQRITYSASSLTVEPVDATLVCEESTPDTGFFDLPIRVPDVYREQFARNDIDGDGRADFWVIDSEAGVVTITGERVTSAFEREAYITLTVNDPVGHELFGAFVRHRRRRPRRGVHQRIRKRHHRGVLRFGRDRLCGLRQRGGSRSDGWGYGRGVDAAR